ncbi:related to CCG-8 clock-controlled gene-8 protein [Cephalotrichum gorgonifer]|uniref:Related to CCG-8 clock-controlled gene-8 protein n=1 Tax=Cephalotrichum gorgonifer TaxID=2041049 RepID=A0AAE8MWU2_9PEZI|nr:related to CCG-8 clock-controlled gene-8 protein [Cephalotrichum gorgonifer]
MLQRPPESRSRPSESSIEPSTEPWPTSDQHDSRIKSDDIAHDIYGNRRLQYQSHDPSSLHFPEAPATDLPPIQSASALARENGNTLPSLSSVTGCQPLRNTSSQLADSSNTAPPQSAHSPWPTLNHRDSLQQPHAAEGSPARMDVDTTSNSATSAASPDYFDGRASSVSLDDPDVRLAAEALGDLRADFLYSPPTSYTSLHGRSPSHGSVPSAQTPGPRTAPQPEPLISLLTTSHPLLATTIGGAASAYNSSKNYSPRFKSSAEYVEGYLGPIANTVGSVGRVTGVEGSVRWFLGRKQPKRQDLESGQDSINKRRRVDGWRSPTDTETTLVPESPDAPATQSPDVSGTKSGRRLSQASTVDTLPTYEESSPAYTETADGSLAKGNRTTVANTRWQSRLIMSTSGLSIAMSEESLRSLKYCLTWLRWANDHIARVIGTLKETLEQYEQAEQAEQAKEVEPAEETAGSGTPQEDSVMEDVEAASGAPDTSAPRADRKELAARIASLKTDVIKTLRDVVETVSKYTGGALPENARILVRRHLTGLPRKWQLAMATSNPSRPQSSSSETRQQQRSAEGDESDHNREKNVKEGAQRVLILAKEGVDMMAQVSGVLDGTIVSAEEWCERLGRKRREDRQATTPLSQTQATLGDGDVKTA